MLKAEVEQIRDELKSQHFVVSYTRHSHVLAFLLLLEWAQDSVNGVVV